MKRSTLVPIALIVAALALHRAAFAADTPQHHVRGTVSSVSPDKLTIATVQGPVVVPLGASTRYAGVVPATTADITVGTFIGTANVPGPGGARALEVVVFPKAMAGTNEGDYPWDLPAGGNARSAMTNGTVVAPKTSAMTNATITRVTSGAVKTVTLSYRGGTKVVAIPPGAPVVPSLHAARAVIIGEKGAIPPM